MPNLPPLAAIRAFEAAARHQNYTRAGEELGLTQAAVSYQIKSLEHRVGAPLFLRNGRRMELSPAGKLLAPRIERAFHEMEAAFSALADDNANILSISCTQTVATQFLAARLGSFQLANPDLAVRIDFSDRVVDLETGECDVGIRFASKRPEGLEAHFLMRLGASVFAHPDVASHIVSDENIPTARRISPGYGWWRLWDCLWGETVPEDGQDPPSGGAFQSTSQLLDAQAAMAGGGVALLAPALFRSEMEAGRLVRLSDRIAWTDYSLWLVYPEVRRQSQKIRTFRHWLAGELRDFVGDDRDGVLVEGQS